MLKGVLSVSVFLLLGLSSLFASEPVGKTVEKPFTVSSSDGSLTITNNTGRDAVFTVYAITGQVVKSVEMKNDTATFALPRGFYIVKTDGGAVKVVVK